MKFENRLNELRILAGEYSEAQADRVYLEKFLHSKIAILMKQYMPSFPTAAAQEREALAHPEYIELLSALRTATAIAEKSKWLLKIAESGISLYQTEQANTRAELKNLGG